VLTAIASIMFSASLTLLFNDRIDIWGLIMLEELILMICGLSVLIINEVEEK